MDNSERKLVYLTSIIHGLVHMEMLTFVSVNILMANDLGTSITAIGFIGTLGYFMFGLGSLPSGFVIDAIGARTVIVLCTAGMGLANILIAFAHDPFWVMVALSLLGASAGLYHPAGLGIISRSVRHTGYAFGVHGVFGNLGLAFGPLVAGLVASQFGWRWAYLWIAIPAFLMTAIYFFARFPDRETETRRVKTSAAEWLGGGLFLMMALVILLQATFGFIYRASITFMPAYTAHELSSFLSGLDPAARGGIFTGIIFLVGAIGQYLAGRATKRYRVETMQLVCTAIVIPLLFAAGFLGGLQMLLAGMAFGFFFLAMQVFGNTLVAKYSPAGFRGRSYGFSFFVSFGFGSLGSGFAGYVGENFGFNMIYQMLAAVAVISVFIAVIIYFMARKHTRLGYDSLSTMSPEEENTTI